MGCGSSEEEKASVKEPSMYCIVVHDFAEDKAEEWWANHWAMQRCSWAELMKKMNDGANAAGFYNHAFMPVGQTKAYCIWEASSPSQPSRARA